MSPGTSDSSAMQADEAGTWILSLSKPSQYAILALFALYAPSAIGQGPLFEPYLQLLVFVSLVFGSLLVSTTNVAGPLRYGYYNYQPLVAKAHPLVSTAAAKVTGWTPLPFVILALLPWFRTWFFMGVIPVTWQFVRGEHQQAVSHVRNRLDECCSRAEVAANQVLSDAKAAKQYENDLEQKLRAANFYDESSVAWTALDEVPSSSETVHQDVLATRAREVATEVDNVKSCVVKALGAAQTALKLSGEAQNLAARAKTAVEEGRMNDLNSLLSGLGEIPRAADQQSELATLAREEASIHAQDGYLTWLLVREQHRERVAEVANTVNKACISAASLSALVRMERLTAERQERHAEALAAAARNAHAAYGVRLVDFYEESAAAAQAVTAAKSIAEDVQSCMKAAAKAVGSADEVARHALDAKAYASVGDMVNAGASRDKVTAALAESRSNYEAAVDARKSTQRKMGRFFEKPHARGDPDPEGDGTSDQEDGDDDLQFPEPLSPALGL